MTSDHYPFTVELCFTGHKPEKSETNEIRFNFKKANWDMYHNILVNKFESLTNNYLNQLDIDSLNALVTNSIIYVIK